MAAVCRPPVSSGLVSALTFEMEEEAFVTSRHTPSDVHPVQLRRYHQLCHTQLDTTFHLFYERQEHKRRSRARQGRSQSSLSCPSTPGGISVDTRQWKLVRESSDICVYRLKARQARTSTVQAIGTLHGSLTDVMNGLYADSTKTARVLQMLLSPRSLDARVLQVDKSCTDTKPFQFSGIVWMALKLPGLGVCRRRDFVCFKKMDVMKDEMGQEFGYMVLHSIDPLKDEIAVPSFNSNAPVGATWPPFNRQHDTPRLSATSVGVGSTTYVRGFISLAIVFQRVGDDRVAMFAYGQFNPSGRLAPVVSDNCIGEWLTSMANTVQSGQAKNLSRLLVGHKPETRNADQSTARPRCGICARALFFWDAPRNCRGCWKVCCRTCRISKPIFCAHSHSFPSGPCTETFCLACVCAVIPSGATINARLLQRLAKKRKRSPPAFRPTTITSSITDGSIGHPEDARLAAAEVSSISVLSSRESEKYQQYRFSVNARPKKRAFMQFETPNPQEEKETHDAILEVLEHFQIQRQDAASDVSSSNTGTSLRSFRSADLGSTATTPLQLGRYPSNHSLVTHNQSFYHRVELALPSRQNLVQLQPDRPGSFNFQAYGSFWVPRQSTLVKTPIEVNPQLGDEYYQRLLQTYLLHTNSSHSLGSSYGGKSAALAHGVQPPVSLESNLVSELQSSYARAASNYSFLQETSPLPHDVVIYRRFK